MEKHASSLTLSSDNAHVMPSCQANNDTCSCSGVTSFNALIQRMSKSLCVSTCPVHHAKDGDEKVAAQNLLSVVHDTF